MPNRPKRICTWPGCRRLIQGSTRCQEHARQGKREADRRRPSAAKRGYGRRWRRYTRAYLAEHPVCRGCAEPSEQVDHIVPVSGPEDPLFWEPTNHQPLCGSCHSAKTASEDGGWGREGGRGRFPPAGPSA